MRAATTLPSGNRSERFGTSFVDAWIHLEGCRAATAAATEYELPLVARAGQRDSTTLRRWLQGRRLLCRRLSLSRSHRSGGSAFNSLRAIAGMSLPAASVPPSRNSLEKAAGIEILFLAAQSPMCVSGMRSEEH